MSPHQDGLGIASLDDILKQYGGNPELLELILVSKVQEDRRRAEEAKLRSKEIDFCIQKDALKLPSIAQFDKSTSRDETPQSPLRSSSSTTSSLGSPRSLPEQRPEPNFAPTKLPQLLLEPQTTPRFVADRRLPTVSNTSLLGRNISSSVVTRSSLQPCYEGNAEKSSSTPSPPLFHPVSHYYQQSTTSLKQEQSTVNSSSKNSLQKRPYPDEDTPPISSLPSFAHPVSNPPHKLPIPPHPYHSFDSRKKQEDSQKPRAKRRRREMQPITMIIETREFPYNDEYLWKNNGNTVHRTSGNRSIYYKCANNNKGCHVNKTVTFRDNGEYLIKYRGNHLPDCKRIKRVVDV